MNYKKEQYTIEISKSLNGFTVLDGYAVEFEASTDRTLELDDILYIIEKVLSNATNKEKDLVIDIANRCIDDNDEAYVFFKIRKGAIDDRIKEIAQKYF